MCELCVYMLYGLQKQSTHTHTNSSVCMRVCVNLLSFTTIRWLFVFTTEWLRVESGNDKRLLPSRSEILNRTQCRGYALRTVFESVVCSIVTISTCIRKSFVSLIIWPHVSTHCGRGNSVSHWHCSYCARMRGIVFEQQLSKFTLFDVSCAFWWPIMIFLEFWTISKGMFFVFSQKRISRFFSLVSKESKETLMPNLPLSKLQSFWHAFEPNAKSCAQANHSPSFSPSVFTSVHSFFFESENLMNFR